MNLDYFDFAHAGVLSLRARRAFTRAIRRGGFDEVYRYIRFGLIGSIVGGLFISAIFISIGIAMLLISAQTSTVANRTTPTMPEAAGAPPAISVYDDTGLVSDYHLSEQGIEKQLERILNNYHMQVVAYSSSAPAHDVYDTLFTDENGVVLYLEEHEDYGTLTYYWGDNLDGIFTRDNISILNAHQESLDIFTHDRLTNVVSDFSDGLTDLFLNPDRANDRQPIEFGAAIIWIVAAIPAFFLSRRLFLYALGLPRRKADQKEILEIIARKRAEAKSAKSASDLTTKQ